MGSDVDMEGFAGAVALKSAIVTSHCSEIEDFLHSLPNPDTFLDDSLGSDASATSDADNASEELAPGYHRAAAPPQHSAADPTRRTDGQPLSLSTNEAPPPTQPAASHTTYTNHLQIADTVRGLPTAFLTSPRTPPRKSVFIPDPPLVTMSFISPTATSSAASSSPAREQPSHHAADNGDGDGNNSDDDTPPEPQKPYHALLNDGRAAVIRIHARFRQQAEVAALVQDVCAARRQLYLADATLRLPCSLPLRTPAAKPTPKVSRVAHPSRPAWRAAGQAAATGTSHGSRYRAIMRSPAAANARRSAAKPPTTDAVEGPMALKAEVFSRLLARHVARFFLRFLKLEVSLARYRHAVCDEAGDVAEAGAQACQRRVLRAWRRAARAEAYSHALAAHRREQVRAAAFRTWAARCRRRRSEAAAQARAESFYLMALGKRCLAAWRGCSLAGRILDLCDSVAQCARRAHGFAAWRRAFAARVGRRDAALARSFPRAMLPLPPHAAPTGCVGGERTLGVRMTGLLRASLAQAAEVKRAGGHGLLTHSVMEKLCVFDGEAASARVFRRAAEAAAAAAASGSPLTTDAEAAAAEDLAVSAAAATNRWRTGRAASSDPSSHSASSCAASPRPLPPPHDTSDADAFAPVSYEARRSASPADSNAANLVHTVVLLDGIGYEVTRFSTEAGPMRVAEEAAAAAAAATASDGDVGSPQSAATVTFTAARVRSASRSRSWSPTSQSPCVVVVDDDDDDAVGSVLELADVRSSLQQAEASIAVLGSLRSSAVSVSVADPVFETPPTQTSPQPQQQQQQARPSSAWQGADGDEVEESATLSPVLTAAAAAGVARVHSWLHGVCRADMGCRVLKKELEYLLRKARFDRGELVGGTLSPDVFPALRRLPLDQALLGVARLSQGRRAFLTWRARCAERRLLQRADALYERKRTAHIFSRMLAVRRRAEGEAAGRAVAVARHDHRVAATAFVLWQRAFLARRRMQARQLAACFLAWRAGARRRAPQRRLCAAAAARNAAKRREPLPSGAERHKLLRRAMRRWRRTARVGAASAAVADRFYAARLEAKSMQYWRLKMEYQALVRRKQEREAWEKEEALRASYRELLQREVFVAWRNHTRFFTVQAPGTLHTFTQMRGAFVVWRRRLQAARRCGAKDTTVNTTASFLDTSTLGVVSTDAKGLPPPQQLSLKRARRRWAMPALPPQQQDEVAREGAGSVCLGEPSLASEDAEVTAQELSCLSAAAPQATLGSWRSTAVAPSMLLLRESEARRKRMLREVAGACAASSGAGRLPSAEASAPASSGTDAIQQRMYSVAQSVNEALRQELEDSVSIENRMNVLRARYAPMETVHSRVR